jgi:prepilin-type N-terminal cleavage/methylation domain-containing protein
MKNRGFTLIESMIVLAIIGIVVAVAAPVINGKPIGELSRTECVGGYLFDKRSNKQIIGEKGGGVLCTVEQTVQGPR